MIDLLVAAVVIVAGFVINNLIAKRRWRKLHTWVEGHPGAELYAPFEPGQHPDVPIPKIIENRLKRYPLQYGMAVQTRLFSRDVWFVEYLATVKSQHHTLAGRPYRATAASRTSEEWFTVMACRCTSESMLEKYLARFEQVKPPIIVRVFGLWVCLHSQGLMSVKLIEQLQNEA
jgi:hypothetical protein